MQAPPPFSAKRIGGARAYQLARRHQLVELEPVEVEIYALELLDFDGERAHFTVECSGGTYVRSLAHDIGKRIGCGAHLEGLRRTAVAEFQLDRAIQLAQLEATAQESTVGLQWIPLEALLPECPELMVRGGEERRVRHGHTFELVQAASVETGVTRRHAMSLLKITNSERRLIAVARHVSGNVYHPDLVLA